MVVKFTRNKQVVRDLQCELIRKRLGERLGYLRYFGLSSPAMKDVRDWAPLFSGFQLVERGAEGEEWHDQHELLVNAALSGLAKKVRLLRGDIDVIICDGQDSYGVPMEYPVDVASLDYSGGLLYRDDGEIPRLRAIEKLIEDQARFRVGWLLFISMRLDPPLNGEVKYTLANIRTELNRWGASADDVIKAALDHPRDEIRFKIYLPYFVNRVSAPERFRCHTEKPMFYEGNRGARMMNFQFYLQPDPRTVAPRFPQERLVQILNAPLIEIKGGKICQTTLGLPKLVAASRK